MMMFSGLCVAVAVVSAILATILSHAAATRWVKSRRGELSRNLSTFFFFAFVFFATSAAVFGISAASGIGPEEFWGTWNGGLLELATAPCSLLIAFNISNRIYRRFLTRSLLNKISQGMDQIAGAPKA